MRVLQINSVCGVGSTGRITTDLYKVLEEKGHECLIAYGRGIAPEGINSYKIGTNLDNYLHVARTRLLDQHGYGSKKPTMELVKKIKEYNPDIIHIHNLHGYYLNLEVLFNYFAESNKPIVWTLHDCWAFTGHCAYFDYVSCLKWQNKCFKCPQKMSYPKSIIVDNSNINYKKKKELFLSLKNLTIITPSNWLASLVKSSFLGSYNIKVINNGIDLNSFYPKESNFREKHGLHEKKLLLGVASEWEKRKGLEVFVTLSKQLSEEYKIILVGLSDKQKKEISENILAISKTQNINELAELYSVCDIFINPTLEDNFPTTNLEALACGTPIITFDTGGSPESIDRSCGFVIDKGNINKLLQKIKHFDFENKTKANCINKAKSFDRNQKYLEYMLVYKELV